jgi:hypothetical protein
MIKNSIPSGNPMPEPRAGSPEKWLALIGFVVVTASGLFVSLFGK